MTLDDNPRGVQAVEISSAFSGIAFIIVVLRLYTRFFVVPCPGVEDYFVSFAMMCSIGLTICIGLQAMCGMGQHFAELGRQDMRRSLEAFYASLIVYNLSLGLIKTSILLQYKRVFSTKKFQIVCWIVLSVVVVHTSWSVSSSIFACLPIRAFWTKEPSKCIDQYAMWFTNAAINITTDFTLILLPIPVIKRLQLAPKQKIALIGIFAVGGFICIVSILRLHSLVAISNSTDPTYDNPPAATWSSIETNVGIICSCLPCLRPLLFRCLPGKFSSSPKDTASSVASFFSRGVLRRRPMVLDGERYVQEGASVTCEACEGGNMGRAEREGSIIVTTEVRVKVDDREHWDEQDDKGGRGVRRESSADSLCIISDMVGV